MAKERLKAQNPHIATRIEFGLLLAHSLLYTRLSLNISREVFTYIPADLYHLGSVTNQPLVVYDLTTESMTVTYSDINLNLAAAGIAMLNTETILVAGGRYSARGVKSVNIWTGVMKVEVKMAEGRSWPGMQVYRSFVWVFGGNTGPSLSSAERFHRIQRNWQSAPTMLSPRPASLP